MGFICSQYSSLIPLTQVFIEKEEHMTLVFIFLKIIGEPQKFMFISHMY